jgi:hypothetical protein
MGILLWLGKPLLYLAFCAVADRRTSAEGPHWGAPRWVVVVAAALARAAAGAASFALTLALFEGAFATGRHLVLQMLMIAFGLGWWLLALRVAFRKAPRAKLLAMAVAFEVVIGAIDVLAWHDVQSINFC